MKGGADDLGIRRIQAGLRVFFLVNVILGVAFGLLAIQPFPDASFHLFVGAAVGLLLYFLVPRVPVDVVILAFGFSWSVQVLEFLYLFGPGSGFQLLMAPVIFAVFLFEHRSLGMRIVMATLPILGIAAFMPLFLLIEPHYRLSALAEFWFHQTNFLVSIGLSLSIIIYFARGLVLRRAMADREAELRGHLIRDLSHELKTPLAAMLTRTQVELSKEENPERIDKALRIIERNTRGMSRLVHDMLDVSRLDSDEVVVGADELNLGDFLREVVELHRPLGEEKSLQWTLSVGDPEVVRTDPLLLGKILNNLIGNAVRYSPSGGMVAIRAFADPSGGSPRIDVTDEGPGISRELLPRLFDPFFRGDASRSRKEGNFGLGLSIAKRAADQLGSRIEVHSEPGEGSCFSVVL